MSNSNTPTDKALFQLRVALGLISAPSVASGSPGASSGPSVQPTGPPAQPTGPPIQPTGPSVQPARNQVPGYIVPGQIGSGGSLPAAPMPSGPWGIYPRYALRTRARNGGSKSVASSPIRRAWK
ncbi:hypothetical protein PG990_008517 [Apiospora arundinis]